MSRRQRDRSRRDWGRIGRQAGRITLDYATIALGSLLVAIATDFFMVPNRVVSGGMTGVGTILYYTQGLPVGLVTALINVPLLLADLKWGGGWRSTVRTIFSVAVMSLAIDLLQPHVQPITSDPLLYTLFGGLLDGLGLGLVFRARGTTGGTDIIARLANRFLGIKLGHTLLFTNVIIMGSAAFLFGIEAALYAMLLAFVSSQVIDLVQEGLAHSRSTMIISDAHEAIRQAILEEMGRGVTMLHAEGGHTQQNRPVLLVAIAQTEISRLKRLVQEIDPDAFVIVTAASEVLGEGFKRLQAP